MKRYVSVNMVFMLVASMLVVFAPAGFAAGSIAVTTTGSEAISNTVSSAFPRNINVDDIEERFAKYYDQDIVWVECPESHNKKVTCGTFEVPVNWSDSNSESITLFFGVMKATKPAKKKGSVVVHVGGPGQSAYNAFFSEKRKEIGKGLKKYFDIIVLDPRGVGYSTPLHCEDSSVTSIDFVSNVILHRYEKEKGSKKAGYIQYAKDFYESCDNKELAQNVSAVDVARDFDVARAVLNEEKLNFLGFSYGTYVGAQYAEFFPENVGRFVLDSVYTGYGSYKDDIVLSTKTYDSVLKQFLEYCRKSTDNTCPLDKGSVEATREYLEQLRDELNESPIVFPADDTFGFERVIYGGMYIAALRTALGSSSSMLWDLVINAFREPKKDNVEPLANQYFMFLDPKTGEAPSSITGISSWIRGITCSDMTNRETNEVDFELVESFTKEAGVFTDYIWTQVFASCIGWPKNENNALPKKNVFTAKGSAPILILAGTDDPQTPIEQALELHDTFESSRLLIRDASGHIQYKQGSKCIDRTVHMYFKRGKLPKDGFVCMQDQ